MLLLLYGYFVMVDLSPGKPAISEILVWIWAVTLWLEELRQVCFRNYDFCCMNLWHVSCINLENL